MQGTFFFLIMHLRVFERGVMADYQITEMRLWRVADSFAFIIVGIRRNPSIMSYCGYRDRNMDSWDRDLLMFDALAYCPGQG